ncbi:succinate dehydrogenase/fumarate reductase flavo protein [Aspergillus campestris IBT 28561]|uniref:Succinate dehydrogenase/fumarate reductase flavo protein n=1 Tax=Aspergillus campestris (strain IBT 28561) TaxID=1392248 RepID=A0A2I1D7L6_ASPC2|nr:succinate dehydrogenase/fumarate reductase flavo protein [Aspergillus campestris IBT 28561]PKY05848.1 succinate dehydrogenase/fumarate reductase flavo protein [Aspergillus campestris IBT 28561]
MADLRKTCMGRSDPELANALVADSNSAVKWLASEGIRFQLSFNRQAYEVDGRIKFWGGLSLKTQDGGKGLIADYRAAAKRHGVRVAWSTALSGIQTDAVDGSLIASVKTNAQENVIKAGAIVLAAGGFESNARMRSQFLGPGWDLAMVRGTPYNTGDVLELGIQQLGAQPVGNWSGCHSVAWDAAANPNTGDRVASNEFTKSGYPLGLMINVDGRRFVDEGIDMRNFTYAKFGRAILQQPEQAAFQVWDSRTKPWLRPEEYREERVEHISADTLEELVEKCASCGLQNREAFLHTLREYNEAVYAHRRENPSATWDPAIKDGLSTQSSAKQLALAKSNWALPLDQGPYLAIKVTCGITFTFGGLKVDARNAQMIASATGQPIPGVYCVGEMMGGLFYSNYPGGSGLTSGAVFGRRAGKAAAAAAHKRGSRREVHMILL